MITVLINNMRDLNYNTNKPLVSIGVPTYNSEQTIIETLKSIISQTYTNLEIILIDNNSSDETVKKINEIKDERIKLIINSINIGANNNFTKCVKEAKGEYIAVFNSDDIYDKFIIEKEVDILLNNPNIGAVFTIRYNINEKGDILRKCVLPEDVVEKDMNFYDLINSILKYGDFLTTPSALIRSNIYKKNLPFNSKLFGSASDLAMWLNISKDASIYIINEPLILYRKHEKQYTYRYNHYRTKIHNYFTVIDFFLKKEKAIIKNYDDYERYNIYKTSDMLSCNINKILLISKDKLYNLNINYKKLRILNKKAFFFHFIRFLLYDIFKNTSYIRFIAILLQKMEFYSLELLI